MYSPSLFRTPAGVVAAGASPETAAPCTPPLYTAAVEKQSKAGQQKILLIEKPISLMHTTNNTVKLTILPTAKHYSTTALSMKYASEEFTDHL